MLGADLAGLATSVVLATALTATLLLAWIPRQVFSLHQGLCCCVGLKGSSGGPARAAAAPSSASPPLEIPCGTRIWDSVASGTGTPDPKHCYICFNEGTSGTCKAPEKMYMCWGLQIEDLPWKLLPEKSPCCLKYQS